MEASGCLGVSGFNRDRIHLLFPFYLPISLRQRTRERAAALRPLLVDTPTGFELAPGFKEVGISAFVTAAGSLVAASSSGGSAALVAGVAGVLVANGGSDSPPTPPSPLVASPPPPDAPAAPPPSPPTAPAQGLSTFSTPLVRASSGSAVRPFSTTGSRRAVFANRAIPPSGSPSSARTAAERC